jgi:hypothetical protein
VSPTEERPTPATAVVAAIRGGDLASLQRLLDAQPGLVTVRVNGRTALHVVTDWPGYYPNGPAVVRMLVAAGADPDARTEGKGAPETPLHWAGGGFSSRGGLRPGRTRSRHRCHRCQC